MLRLGKVGKHLGGRSEEDQLPPLIQQERLLEHLEDLGGRLMDRDEHDLVVGHASDDLDDVLGILGGKAARRLIEEVDVGSADHIEADIQPLALASAEHLALGATDHLAAAFVEP